MKTICLLLILLSFRAYPLHAQTESRGLKSTGFGVRWYSYYDFIDYILGNPFSGSGDLQAALPLWNDAGLQVRWGSSVTTVKYASVSQVIDPIADVFNIDTDLINGVNNTVGAGNMIRVRRRDAYFIDSISIRGIYYKVKTLRSDADSLILSIVPIKQPYLYTRSSWDIRNYTNDSLLYAFAPQNTNGSRRTALSDPGLSAGITWSVPLMPAMGTDTIAKFSFAPPSPVFIPAGCLAAVTVTFKSTDAWSTPGYLDDYDRFMPLMGFEYPYPVGGYMTYWRNTYKNDCNGAGLMYNTNTSRYVPTIADQGMNLPTTQFYLFEYAAIDALVRCSSCVNIADICCTSVNSTAKLVNSSHAYPNPANNSVTISLILSNPANVKISIINTEGQIVAQRETDNVSADAIPFNVASLPAGMYYYLIQTNNEYAYGKFAITH